MARIPMGQGGGQLAISLTEDAAHGQDWAASSTTRQGGVAMKGRHSVDLEGVEPWQKGSSGRTAEVRKVLGWWASDLVADDGSFLARFKLDEPMEPADYANIKCALTGYGDTEEDGKLSYVGFETDKPGGNNYLYFKAPTRLPESGMR